MLNLTKEETAELYCIITPCNMCKIKCTEDNYAEWTPIRAKLLAYIESGEAEK